MGGIFLARTSAVGLCGALLLASLSLPAWANGDSDPDGPISEVVNEALLEVVGESLDEAPSFDLDGTALHHEGDDFAVAADLAEGGTFEVVMEPIDPDGAEGERLALSIEVPGLAGEARVNDQLIAQADPIGESETVVQSHDHGLRVIEVIHGPSAPGEYLTHFSSDREIDPVFMEDGTIFLHDTEGDYLGHLDPPWAVDANGKSVPTSYSWRDGTLVQHVEHSSGDYQYPIVSDPTWNYTFNSQPGGYAPLGVTWQRADSELRRCFNCSFPISGAPSYFPRKDQIIRLDASPLTAVKKVPAPVRVSSSGPGYFSFLAENGHFDGAGSRISFVFYHTCTGGNPTLRLSVSASVTADRGAAVNAGNAAFAKIQWQRFLDRTYSNTGQRQGYRARC